jgi:outer membrane autotransporter protein
VTNSGSYVSQASSNYFNAGLLVANTGTFTVTNGNSVITGVVTNAGTFNVYNGGGTVSNAVVNRNGVVNLNMGAGNAWTLLGGTTVGDAAGATGAVTLASGTLAVTNGSASAVMDVVRGNLGMTNGTVLADSMYATNGAASVISFNGGTLSVGSLVVSNGSAFVAGNGTLAATNLFLSGYAANGSRFANGLVINTNAVAALGASERLDDATVVKLQGGTLDLGGFSETVGTVLVDGGVVQSSGGGTLSAGAITNLTGGATFLVSGGSLMLAAPVGGGGLLAKTGGGTLVLSGANTYSGATVIGAGTLQVGSGGTSGTLGTGNVTNNAALVFNRSDSVTVGNLIVGTGSLTQSGAGTVVLTGANTYSGGTTVGAGTLGLGADNVLGGGLVTMSGGGLATSGGARALINAVNLASGASFDTAAGNLTMSGAITNGGSLVKSGANTLILGGANSYSGATVIGAGTVQVGSGGTSGTLGTGNVTNNAALVFNRSDSVTAGNLIAGTGSLTQGGTGTLILSGANTYSGGTVVQAGTLQIAGDGNLGAAAGSLTLTNGANLQITGDVSMGRALSVNAGGVRLTLGANTLSNSGSLSGTGALTLSGAGLLALTGDGSGYSGAVTNLNGATLRLDSANALGSAGLVLGASTVVTNTATTTISGTLSGGTGIVLGKSGAGRLMLSGNSGASFLGDTRVSGGTLAVNGSLGGSAVTVGSGARLEGTGTVGALVNHGTVQPGDASTIGTLTVSGAYTNAADGTLAMKLGNGGLCDRLLVGGAAVLDGSLSLTTLGGYVPHAGDTFTNLVTAAGGVSGKFAATSLTPTLEFTVSYNANDVGVRMGAAVTRNYVGPGLGLNGSQMELGQALQGAAGTASGDLNTVLSAIDQLGTADSVRQAYNEILPAKFVGLTAVGMNGSMLQVNNLQNHFMNMNSGPMAAASVGESAWGRKPIALAYNGDLGDLGLGWPEGREPLRREWQFFIQGMGTIADQETTATSPGFSYTAEGMTLGADYRLTPELAVGVSTGYSHTGSNLAGSGGTVDVETIPLWIYESWQTGGWHLDAGGGFSLNLYENERNIRFPGIERTAKSDPLGTQADGFLGGGYDFRVGRWTVGPMGSVRYTKLWIEDFTESGADALNLAVAGQEAQSLQSGLGVRAAYEWDVGGVKLTPNAQASYQHEYCNDSRGIEARLAQGSSAFQVKTDSPERNFVEIGAGMNVILNDQVSIFLHYDTEAGRETFSTHSVNGGLQVSF